MNEGDAAADLIATGWFEHEGAGFLQHIGPVWEHNADGQVRLGLQTDLRHENLRGVLQGGVMMTLADRALGQTGRLHNDFRPQATVQFDMQFIAPVEIGAFLIAHGRLIEATGRLMFLEGTLFVGDRTVATARGVWAKLALRE